LGRTKPRLLAAWAHAEEVIASLTTPDAARTLTAVDHASEQGTGPLNEPSERSVDDRLVAEETRSDFVAVTETEGDVTRGKTVASVTARKTFDLIEDEADDMPLPTDPKTIFLGGLFVLACMAALYVAAEIVLPLILAIVLKLLLQPFVRLLERVYIPRAIGAILAVLLVLLAFAGTISMLAGPAAAWAGKLPDAIPKLRDSLGFLREPIVAGERMLSQIPGFSGELGAAPQGPAVKPSNLVGAVLSGSASVTSSLFTTMLILFYMLVSGETFLRRMVEILPRFKNKRQAVELSQHIERDVSAYLITVTCINALVGVATGCDMWLCGVANPMLWGAVAFVLNFVPILGAMVGMAVFLMVSVVSLGVSWWALLPVGLYFGIHIIEGEFATPMVLARRFTINPVAVILALIFWGWMWGVAGAILAVPLLAITKIICDDLRPLRAFGHLLEN
jgi:predicted PurR-regulated permease PerM